MRLSEVPELRTIQRMAEGMKRFGVSAKKATAGLERMARALRGEPLDLANPGDYIRVTNILDEHFKCIGEVLWVEKSTGTTHVRLNPFNTGVKHTRPIDPGCFEILSEMEVIAEAAR